MERKALVVCSLVVILGILMVATGFAAEGTRTKPNQVFHVTSSDICIYPRSPAMGLGLTAALSLLLAQITIKASTGCICCIRGPRPPASRWRIAVICFVISWITYVIAFLLLLAGAALNTGRREERKYFTDYGCYILKPGVFAFATIVGAASISLGLTYFLIMNSVKNDPSTVWGNPSVPPPANIAMGQPQFPAPPPPRTADPVFVHEDTYMRRQFT